MKKLLKALLRPLWRAVRWRVAEMIAAEAGDRLAQDRELDARVGELTQRVAGIDHRLHVLEREYPVLTQHVSALTMEVAGRPVEELVRDTEAVAAARLSAIAFYEERISRLEAALRPAES